MTKLIFMPSHKGWFKGLGLHHASLTIILIAALHTIGLGWFGSTFAVGWYGSREYGSQLGLPKTFEIMDFVSPAIVSFMYLVFL